MIPRFYDFMNDEDIRKAFGARLKTLRKQMGLTQKELARQIDVRLPQLNKYEAGIHMPPVEKLIQMAKIFRVTMDFLLLGEENGELTLNQRLIQRFKAIEKFCQEDQEMVLRLIEAVIVKERVEGAVALRDG